MITDAATNATVWLDGEDERVLHELLASSRAVGRGAAVRAGRGGVVVTEDGERLVMHYNAEAYQSLDSVLQVFEMMWEDYEAVPENVLPLYCELDLFGFQAAGEAILRMHGGMHEMSDLFDCKGPWQLSVVQRKDRRRRADLRIGTWHWPLLLRRVRQVADESRTPEYMPSYKTLQDEGLAPVALALRNRSTLQARPLRRALASAPCSGRYCVAACCSVLQCAAVCCSVLQCVAVCCSVLQCVAACRSVMQCGAAC